MSVKRAVRCVGPLLDLDVQPTIGHRVRGACDPAVEALECDGARTAGQADAVGHFSDGADIGEFLLVPGNEQHPILVARIDGEGH
jgi:hypothetical protein